MFFYKFLGERMKRTWRWSWLAIVCLLLGNNALAQLVKAPSLNGAKPTSQWILNNGSQGKEFVFCLPLNDCPTCQVTAREIYVTSSKNTSFYYEVPATGFKTRLTVQAFQVRVIDGASGMFPMPEISSSEQVSDLGITISADDNVSVYVYNGKDVSSDGYLAIPVASWGKEYIALTYPDFSEVRAWKGGFAFFAAEDNTECEIFLRSPSVGEYATTGFNKRTEGGHKYGDHWKVTLNRGQCYLIQGDGTSRGQFDLSGSRVIATKPIGFICYHQRTMIPSFSLGGGRDHICEMIPPTSQWGKTYVSIEILRNNKGDLYRAVALQDGTTIVYSAYDFKTGSRNRGPTGVFNLKAGQAVSLPKSPEEAVTGPNDAHGIVGMGVFNANKPFLLMHECCSANWDGSGDYDPFTVYCVAAEQYTKGTIFQSPLNSRYTNHFFGLIAIGDTNDPSAKKLKSIKLDGKYVFTISPSFLGNHIPGTNFYYARLNVSSGSHYILGDTPFGGEIYGYGQFDSYGWPAATAFRDLSTFDTLPPVLVKTEECGDFTFQGTELRNFKVNDTLNHVETGVREIDFVDSLDERSYNYRINVIKSDGKDVYDGKVPGSSKNERITFRLEVIDKSKDAYAKFFVMDRALNITYDSVRWNAPKIFLNPDPVDFGNVRIGSSKTMKVWIKNMNDSALYIKDIRLKTGAVFSLNADPIPDTVGLLIKAKDSLLITITYKPTAESTSPAIFDFDSLLVKEFCAPFRFYVRGRGVQPHIQVGDFKAGLIGVNEKVCNSSIPGTITIQNTGTDTLHVTGIDESKIVPPFSIVKPTTPPFTIVIPPGGSVLFHEACFQPTDENSFTIDVPFISDAPTSAKDDPISTWSGSSNSPGPYVIGNNWDSVRLGVTKTLPCWVGNSGTQQVKCLNVDTSGTTEFRVKKIERDPPFWVYPNHADSVRVDVDFLPTIEGPKSPYIVGTFENTGSKRDFLKGFGYLEKIKTTGAEFKDTLLVGTVVNSTKTGEFVEISNTSTSRWLTIHSIDFIKEADDDVNFIYPNDFAWVRPLPTDTIMEIGGATLQLPVRFSPSKSGLEKVRVRIVHNAEPITANPSGTWADTVYVIGHGTIQNPPYIKGYNYGSVLACDPKLGFVTVGNSAIAGSKNANRILDSLWIDGPEAAYFKLVSVPSSTNPVVIPPDTAFKFSIAFLPEALRNRTYKAVVHARFNDGVVLSDSVLASGYFVSMDVAVNEPTKLVNMAESGSQVAMSLSASSATWPDVGLTRFTAFIRYGLFDLQYVQGSCKIGQALDNTWKIDSARQVSIPGTDSAMLIITASGQTPAKINGNLCTFSMQLLINSTRVSEFHTDLRFLPQNNTPDTTREECVVVNPKGNVTYITGCFLNGRFISVGETNFALHSVDPHPATDGVTTIDYSVGFEAKTTIEIVNSIGEVVARPLSETQKAGNYKLVVDIRSLSSGMYVVRMNSADNLYSLPLVISR